jgi:hypothetical protein
MPFNRRAITKELDNVNLQRHNDNYTDIETELDTHDNELLAANQHIANGAIHTTQVEKDKLAGIQAQAEVNQNAFSKVSVVGQSDVDADSKTDTLTLEGGTGITVTTDPATDKVIFTATGTATPGAHASSHITGGADVIPIAIAGGNSGLMSGADKTALDQTVTGLTAHVADTVSSGVHGIATTADLTYYVRKDGSDSNNGLANTAGGAFLTITKAISVIPKIVNHGVTINVADGTYNETVTHEGFHGSGGISLIGNATTPVNCKANNFIVRRCFIGVTLNGFEAISTTADGFAINRAIGTNLNNLACTSVSALSGVLVQYSVTSISNSNFSNRNRGIDAQSCSIIASDTNGGTGNTIGLYCVGASKIGKIGAQPAGATAEFSGAGGQIL